MDKQEIRKYLGRETTLIGASAIFFIASFLPYVKGSVSGKTAGLAVSSFGASEDAWHGISILGLLLVFGALAVYFLRAYKVLQVSDPRIGIGILAAGALGMVLVILHGLTQSGGSENYGAVNIHVSVDPSWGYFILVISGLVALAGLWLAHQRSAA